MGLTDRFSSNSDQYTQRLVTQETLKATQEELSSKIRELQIYEANFLQQKRDIARWKKKFEFIFHENELLSLETTKLDAAHKQISFLQQENKFKDEEIHALRSLVSALEAANKKARAAKLERSRKSSGRLSANITTDLLEDDTLKSSFSSSISSRNSGLEQTPSDIEQSENCDESTITRSQLKTEREKFEREITSLKVENGLLLKDLDQKTAEVKLHMDQLQAYRDRVENLEAAALEDKNTHMSHIQEKQREIVDLENQIILLEKQRRRSSAAPPPLNITICRQPSSEKISPEKTTSKYNGFETLPNQTLSPRSSEASNRSDTSPDTPPGTPPPITSGGLLPDEFKDPNTDTVIKNWADNKSVRAAADASYDPERLRNFFDKLPYEFREHVSKLLLDAMNPKPQDTNDDTERPSSDPLLESQILIRAVPQDQQKELISFIIPLLKAHHHIKVKYATMMRRTLVTDVRITIQPREEAFLGISGSRTSTPGLNSRNVHTQITHRFGAGHTFLGPASNDDVGHLVPHSVREISSESQAKYISRPEKLDALRRTNSRSDATSKTDSIDSSPGSGHENASPLTDHMASTASSKFGRFGKFGNIVAGSAKNLITKFNMHDAGTNFEHEGTVCQFCKMSPIKGKMYVCAMCVNFQMCENCYSLGGHGLENSNALFHRVQELIIARCPRLSTEIDLIEMIRYEICRSNLRKFKFCLNWLADILLGKSSCDLSARALEIPNIRRDVRKQFVPLLIKLCSDRTDIEVRTEWELESDNGTSIKSLTKKSKKAGNINEGDGGFLEILRIWVADQYRTTSPFLERTLLEFRDDMILPNNEDEKDMEIFGAKFKSKKDEIMINSVRESEADGEEENENEVEEVVKC